MRRTSLALALATLPFTALAATEDSLLPVIVVKATASHSGDDSNDLLTRVPGISFYSAGGVSALPVIHGLADDRVKVRIDGMEITSACGNHMNAPLSYVDPAKVGDLQVMAGITPVSQGGDSIGGTINVSSPRPVFAERDQALLKEGSISLQGRSVDNGLTTSIGGTLATDRLSLGYSASIAHADSYQDGNGNKVRDTLYEARNQVFSLAARGDGQSWALRLGEQHIPYQGFPNQAMDMTGNRAVFANLNYLGDFAWGALEARLYWQDTRHKMGFFTPEKTGIMPMDTRGRDMGYSVKADVSLQKDTVLRLGHEYHHTTLDDWWSPVAGSMMMKPDTFVNINGGKRDRFVLFTELESSLTERWTGLLGLRSETVSMDTGQVQEYGCGMMCAADAAAAIAFNGRSHDKRDNNLDFTAQARYAPDAGSRYEFAYARKTRSPNLYERYTWGRGNMAMAMIGWFGDKNYYVGDIDLKPEVAHTLSTTLAWHDSIDQSWEFKATPYYTYVQDFIDVDDLGTVVSGGSSFAKLQFANHNARLHGLDLSGRLALWDNSAYGHGQLKGLLGWVQGSRQDGGDLYHMMPINARLGLEQTLGQWTNDVEFQLVGRKNQVDNLRREPVTAGYALVNLHTSYQWTPSATVTAGISNLFDRAYFLPLGGVDYADWKAGGRQGQIGALPGAGRSFNLGLTLKF